MKLDCKLYIYYWIKYYHQCASWLKFFCLMAHLILRKHKIFLVEYIYVCIIIANNILMWLNVSSYNSDRHNQHVLDQASCDCTVLDFYAEVFFLLDLVDNTC